MRRRAAPVAVALPPAVIAVLAVLAGCASPSERGRADYQQYCASCHGATGRGDGLSGVGLTPAPRDFTRARFKFGWVIDGLPRDEDLARIVRDGLGSGAMAPSRLPDEAIDGIVRHLKSFDPEAWAAGPVGRAVEPPADPWGLRTAEAVARGRSVYHGVAQCHACHPAFIARAEVVDLRARASGAAPELVDTRVDLHEARAERGGALPPDFTIDALRSVRAASRREDLYRVIAAGIPGTAMPTWDESLPPEDLWALAWYVDSLCALRDTAEGAALRARLRSEDASEATPAPR